MFGRILVFASLCAAVTAHLAHGQVLAPSTWASNIVIDPQPRDMSGMPIGSPSSAAFDDWDSVPLAVADPLFAAGQFLMGPKGKAHCEISLGQRPAPTPEERDEMISKTVELFLNGARPR